MRIPLFLLFFVFTLASSVHAQNKNRSLLNSMHRTLNVMCRGGHGDDPITDDACSAREQVTVLLKSTTGDGAVALYKRLNEMCRGYSGDKPETQEACGVKEKASLLLRNLGYCWRNDWWLPCTKPRH